MHPFDFCLTFRQAVARSGMDYQFDTHFTLEEANELLPGIIKAFGQLHEYMSAATASAQEKAEIKNPASRNGNGKAHKPLDYKTKSVMILTGIAEFGIIVQDWRRGLIDFPHLRDGKEVFLCYELSDGERIGFYHELDAGYAGRQPLTSE
jgi:hypothetical protein